MGFLVGFRAGAVLAVAVTIVGCKGVVGRGGRIWVGVVCDGAPRSGGLLLLVDAWLRLVGWRDGLVDWALRVFRVVPALSLAGPDWFFCNAAIILNRLFSCSWIESVD